MKRIGLFLMTNIAILVVLSIVLQLLGVERILDEQGVGLNYWNLLIFCAVFGMGGSFISLLISKWMAKRMTGARVIDQPSTQAESWLVQTVSHQAQAAGIVEADRLAALLFRRQIGAHRTDEQPGDLRPVAEEGGVSRRMPCGTGGELTLLQQQRLRPAEACEPVEDTRADDAAADDDGTIVGVHDIASRQSGAR